MKRVIIIRLSFAIFVYLIFIVVELLNLRINNLLKINIDSKYFLLLISFLFYDIWTKYSEIFTVTLNVREKTIKDDEIKFKINVKYWGKEKLYFSLISISGIKGYNPELIYSDTSEQEKTYVLPEDFEIFVNETSPIFYLNIKLKFRNKVTPKITIPFINIEVFLINMTFIVGDKKRIKRVFFIRRRSI